MKEIILKVLQHYKLKMNKLTEIEKQFVDAIAADPKAPSWIIRYK